jgi:hypothetical protein
VATPSGTEPGRSARSAKWAVDRLDSRERRLSFVAAVGAALFGVLLYLYETQNKNFRLAKGQLTPQTTLVLGLVCGGLLFGATFIGRRAPVGFVALFTFLLFGTSTLFFGLPFLVLAVWLLYRSYKVQKEATAKLRAERAEGSATTTASGRNGTRPSSAPRSSTAGSRKKGPAKPEANKRYTPKRPPPPAPKPSRRERKAADASD